MIPSEATLVFDVMLLDVWNKDDDVEIRLLFKPLSCRRSVQRGDFVRYMYNGSLINGTNFESRYECYITKTHWNNLINSLIALFSLTVMDKMSHMTHMWMKIT